MITDKHNPVKNAPPSPLTRRDETADALNTATNVSDLIKKCLSFDWFNQIENSDYANFEKIDLKVFESWLKYLTGNVKFMLSNVPLFQLPDFSETAELAREAYNESVKRRITFSVTAWLMEHGKVKFIHILSGDIAQYKKNIEQISKEASSVIQPMQKIYDFEKELVALDDSNDLDGCFGLLFEVRVPGDIVDYTCCIAKTDENGDGFIVGKELGRFIHILISEECNKISSKICKKYNVM